ncbi:MAG TPA: four helix bundle protein [Armatimonadota bacterium]|jgi:four helix bundle protein
MAHFEELIAWQKARQLAASVYTVTRSAPWAKDFGLAGQIQRAAVSIMANIAEGNERGSSVDYHRFLCMAKGSCAEDRSHLCIAFDIGYLNEDSSHELMKEADEVSRLVGGLRAAIARRLSQETLVSPPQPSAPSPQP